jgi:hypothetical protein
MRSHLLQIQNSAMIARAAIAPAKKERSHFFFFPTKAIALLIFSNKSDRLK